MEGAVGAKEVSIGPGGRGEDARNEVHWSAFTFEIPHEALSRG